VTAARPRCAHCGKPYGWRARTEVALVWRKSVKACNGVFGFRGDVVLSRHHDGHTRLIHFSWHACDAAVDARRLSPGAYGPGVAFTNVSNGQGSTTRPAKLIV